MPWTCWIRNTHSSCPGSAIPSGCYAGIRIPDFVGSIGQPGKPAAFARRLRLVYYHQGAMLIRRHRLRCCNTRNRPIVRERPRPMPSRRWTKIHGRRFLRKAASSRSSKVCGNHWHFPFKHWLASSCRKNNTSSDAGLSGIRTCRSLRSFASLDELPRQTQGCGSPSCPSSSVCGMGALTNNPPSLTPKPVAIWASGLAVAHAPARDRPSSPLPSPRGECPPRQQWRGIACRWRSHRKQRPLQRGDAHGIGGRLYHAIVGGKCAPQGDDDRIARQRPFATIAW